MKKMILITVVGVLLIACCSGSSSDKERQKLPQATPVFETHYGYVYKYKDGKNTVYVYERGGGSAGIAIVTDECQ